MRFAAGAMTVVLAGLVAVNGAGEQPPSTKSADRLASTSDPSTSVPESTAIVSPARRALDDVLSWLELPPTVDPERFTPEFLAIIPHDDLITAFYSLSNTWTVESFDEPSASRVVAVLRTPTRLLQVHLTVDARGRIDSLSFAPPLDDPPETLAQVAELVDGYGPTSAFLAAEVDETGVCRPIAAVRADLVLPLGSVFKLYVLGAVAIAVDEGTVTWDQPVTIRDELDSLPSGITQDEPAGSTLSVEELARRMIAISDNTATDHLIDLVGRPNVEAALEDFGHSDPAITMPFLTTRELFALRSSLELRRRYIDSDVDGRRALLDSEITGRPQRLVGWTEPRAVTTIEWFATPTDICRALVALDDIADDPDLAPVGEIMTANEDQFTTDRLTRVSYKPGGEPGVHFEAWLAVTTTGERFAVIGGAASDTEQIDPALSTILLTALDLLPEQPST
jgi:hypothetical protein